MNRDRAEAYLRLLAEEELRRAAGRRRDGPSWSPPGVDAVRPADGSGIGAGSAAGPAGPMVSGRGWGADRAVAELFSAHYGALVRVAAVLVRDAQVAEEVVQDAFVAMHAGWRRLGDADKALAYLRQSVVNRSRSVLRRRAVPGNGPRRALPGWPAEPLGRVARVGWALTAAGALDGEAAGQVLEDFELALAIRQAGSPGWRGPGLGSWPSPPRRRPVAGSGTGAGPARVVRLGQAVPVRGEDVSGEAYLLSYAQTASGPQLSLFTRGLAQPSRLEQFTATDDRGTRYQVTVRDLGGGPAGGR